MRRILVLIPLVSALIAVAGPKLPSNDKHPYRRFYPAPQATNTPPEALLSCKIDADVVQIYQTEVDAAAQSTPPGLDRLKKLEHQHKILKEKNQKLLEALQAHAKNMSSSRDRKFLDAVYASIDAHPVAGKQSEASYDLTQKVGFCFGRAAYVHLELSRRGVPQQEMLKIFALGKMLHSEMMWDFHVATAVLGPGGAWWMIDSLFESPLELDEWVKRVTRFSLLKTYPNIRFYATDPRKFQPVSGEYNRESLSNPGFKGYFEDLYQSLLPKKAKGA